MVDFRELIRTKAQRVQNPSSRLPLRETNFVSADCIERQMQEDNHTKWGWRMYRCTYKDGEQWSTFLQKLWTHIDENFENENAMDLKSSMDLEIIDDIALEGASPNDVRQMFKAWSAGASQSEQGVPARRAQRYRYCLHVDQAALESVLAGPPAPEDALKGAYVNLVNCYDEFDVETMPEEDDRGFMRIEYSSLMTAWYNLMRVEGAWDHEYREPPMVGTP